MDSQPAETSSADPSDQPLPFSPLTGCLLSILIGLAGVALVFAVGTLAVRGELTIGDAPLGQTRLWLVNDAGNQGLGLSTTSAVPSAGAPGQTCARTRVRFFLWRTAAPVENVTYCDCYTGAPGALNYVGACDE